MNRRGIGKRTISCLSSEFRAIERSLRQQSADIEQLRVPVPGSFASASVASPSDASVRP